MLIWVLSQLLIFFNLRFELLLQNLEQTQLNVVQLNIFELFLINFGKYWKHCLDKSFQVLMANGPDSLNLFSQRLASLLHNLFVGDRDDETN